MKLNLIDSTLLEQHKLLVPENIDEIITKIGSKESSLTKNNFEFYSSIASVFSSKIEGEEIQLDSYLKYKYLGIEYLPDYTKRIDDLLKAYSFASENMLSRENIFKRLCNSPSGRKYQLCIISFVPATKPGSKSEKTCRTFVSIKPATS